MKNSQRILIVDDDTDDREIIRDAFLKTAAEREYVFIESGDKLIEHLQSSLAHQVPALIMLDLNMPGKDGRETLREIKADKRYHHIPTIVLTTSSSGHDRNIAYQLGANCFITKPDTFNKLVNLMACVSELWLA